MFLLRAVETATVLGVFSLACWVGGWLVFGGDKSPRYLRAVALVELMDHSWKAFLLLGIPLFYRPVRAFVERIEKAWGVEAPARPQSLPPSDENPPALTLEG